MARNRSKRLPRLGFWLETASQPACEIARLAGYDVVVLDMEHGVLTIEAADRLIAHSQRLGLAVYSRVAAAERVSIQHALDAGADGVILPQIRNARHAARATAFAKYPPQGTRGMGFGRTMNYGDTPLGFVKQQNRRTRCWAMIETVGALDDVEEIATLETVDGLFIGPSDLSLARGRGAFRATPADFTDLRRIAEVARAAGKPWAVPAPGARMFALATRLGADFVTVADDLSALAAGFAAGLAVAGRRRA